MLNRLYFSGYHESLVDTSVTDFRTEIGGGDCHLSSGKYFIDQKLLVKLLLVK